MYFILIRRLLPPLCGGDTNLGRFREDDYKFKASQLLHSHFEACLGYMRPFLKKRKAKNKQTFIQKKRLPSEKPFPKGLCPREDNVTDSVKSQHECLSTGDTDTPQQTDCPTLHLAARPPVKLEFQ